ncbi:hypothetical protein KDW_41480 [Dictyobacter vulcani]|uniref:Uncharacterized protein n=1 Tax=Dictyobacter vulcani TaxID=2607529 RepID=A0A5J4KXS3_9CHLR|nr:hypothetical protein KDW_41480 [Dictyobacter vulcani]
MLSGAIVTATAVYGFWLDWVDGHYTLGDEQGSWRKIDMSQCLDPEGTIAAQQRLR